MLIGQGLIGRGCITRNTNRGLLLFLGWNLLQHPCFELLKDLIVGPLFPRVSQEPIVL